MVKNNTPSRPHILKDDAFLAAARRAMNRAARKVREENRRLGLPLILGENGKVKKVWLD